MEKLFNLVDRFKKASSHINFDEVKVSTKVVFRDQYNRPTEEFIDEKPLSYYIEHIADSIKDNISDTVGGVRVGDITEDDLKRVGWNSYEEAVEAHQDDARQILMNDMVNSENAEELKELIDKNWPDVWKEICKYT